jgi:hypothetical protein
MGLARSAGWSAMMMPMTNVSVAAGERLIALVNAAEAPLLAQPYFSGGDPGPIVAALAHVPEMLEVTLPFLGAVLGPSAIDLRTKEVVSAPGMAS